MKKCNSCGAFLNDDVAFCPKCGTNVEGLSPEPAEKKDFGDFISGLTEKFGKYMGDNHTYEFDQSDIEPNKTISALSYLGILFFLPLVVCPGSKFGRFHANQSLVLFIVSVLISLLVGALNFVWTIPVLGILLGVLLSLISTVLSIGTAALFFYGLVNTLNGRALELPVIGKITLLK